MSAGVGYALASLVCAGVLDVVFGRYSRARGLTSAYLVATGVVVMLGQTLILAVTGVALALDPSAVLWGTLAGAIVVLANAMLIESLSGINVSLGSTIYRLNTIALVIFAVMLLGEALTLPKSAGVILGVAAVVLLYQRSGGERVLPVFVWIAVGASLLRAVFGVLAKIGLASGTDPLLFMLYVGTGWTLAALAYGVARARPVRADAGVLPHALMSGTLICLVVNFLLLGLRTGEASIVIPIANMSFVVALLFSAASGMERFTLRKLSAVAIAALAIALLTSA